MNQYVLSCTFTWEIPFCLFKPQGLKTIFSLCGNPWYPMLLASILAKFSSWCTSCVTNLPGDTHSNHKVLERERKEKERETKIAVAYFGYEISRNRRKTVVESYSRYFSEVEVLFWDRAYTEAGEWGRVNITVLNKVWYNMRLPTRMGVDYFTLDPTSGVYFCAAVFVNQCSTNLKS